MCKNIKRAINDFSFNVLAKTELGEKLLKYRLLHILKGGKLLDQNEINKIVRNNRGEIIHDDEDKPFFDEN